MMKRITDKVFIIPPLSPVEIEQKVLNRQKRARSLQIVKDPGLSGLKGRLHY